MEVPGSRGAHGTGQRGIDTGNHGSESYQNRARLDVGPFDLIWIESDEQHRATGAEPLTSITASYAENIGCFLGDGSRDS